MHQWRKALDTHILQLTVSPDQSPGLEEPGWFKHEWSVRSTLGRGDICEF